MTGRSDDLLAMHREDESEQQMARASRALSWPAGLAYYVVPIAAAWTAIMVGGFALFVVRERAATFRAARIQARYAFNKDLVYRRWSAGHGGVYAPQTEHTLPNPYLSQLGERDIVTPSGRRLTLINPAYMTRQVHELGRKQYGHLGHITSLRPIRPENAPDPWEAEALRAFSSGEDEVASIKMIEGREYLRLMRPLVTEQGCLTCHASQGYKLGDLRGGISVSVPMAPLRALARKHIGGTALGFGVVWLVGLAGIASASGHMGRRVRERDRAEEELRRERDFVENLIDTAQVIVLVLDTEGRIVRFNRYMEEISGYRLEDVKGKDWFATFVPGRDHDRIRKLFKRAMGDIQTRGNVNPVVDSAGREILVEWYDKTLKDLDGSVVGLLTIGLNITVRKQAEEELHRYGCIVSSSHDMLALLDTRFVYLAANEAYARAFDRSAADLIGHTVSEMFGEAMFEKIVRPNAERCLAGNQVCYQEWLEFPAHGRRYMDVAYFPYPGTGEDDRGFVVSARDITERKLAEDQLQQHQEHLEELVQERTAELEERAAEAEQLSTAMVNLTDDLRMMNADLESTTRQLAETNTELESFSYSVSHDLRAPIRAIDGFSKVLLEEHAGQLDDEGKRVLGIVLDSTRDMGNLIDDLLAFSRLSRREMKLSTVNMTQLARDVFEQLRQGARGRELSLSIGTLPPARCDRGLIREVFLNLLANAIKFTEPREEAVIEVTGRVEGPEAVYSVRDNGVGFNMDYADKLFEVFQRLHSVEEFEGTGIGLALVQRIIHRHGGGVWGEGRLDEGATFHFSLPSEKESKGAERQRR